MIQPFDERYDKLYEDTFHPAIEGADLLPYRVDRDPSAAIPIEGIEDGIDNSTICFADISTDNPNVWFELGYAISRGKGIVITCTADRTKYPFDIQHRTVISYKSDSPRDFTALQQQITERAKALVDKENTQSNIRSARLTKPTSGLDGHEITCLATIAAQIDGLSGRVSHFVLQSQMEKAGFTAIATKLALRKLMSNDFVEVGEDQDWNSSETFEVVGLTDSGWNWIAENQDKLNLKVASQHKAVREFDTSHDDDIPF